jgi:hypothetical protein
MVRQDTDKINRCGESGKLKLLRHMKGSGPSLIGCLARMLGFQGHWEGKEGMHNVPMEYTVW